MKSLLTLSVAFFALSASVASAQDTKPAQEVKSPAVKAEMKTKAKAEGQSMSEEAASIKAQSKTIRDEMSSDKPVKSSATARCPEGTTVQPDKSCMVTGEFDVKPHKKSHKKEMKAPEGEKDTVKTDMSEKALND